MPTAVRGGEGRQRRGREWQKTQARGREESESANSGGRRGMQCDIETKADTLHTVAFAQKVTQQCGGSKPALGNSLLTTHTHTHARTHAHTHACTHACTHARTHARTHAHTHTHTHLWALSFSLSSRLCSDWTCSLRWSTSPISAPASRAPTAMASGRSSGSLVRQAATTSDTRVE